MPGGGGTSEVGTRGGEVLGKSCVSGVLGWEPVGLRLNRQARTCGQGVRTVLGERACEGRGKQARSWGGCGHGADTGVRTTNGKGSVHGGENGNTERDEGVNDTTRSLRTMRGGIGL